MTDCTTDGALMDYLCKRGLLCQICEESPWTVWATWHPQTRLCAACAQEEPKPEDEDDVPPPPQPYSVLLLYPDALETYYTHVWAAGPGEAVQRARAEVHAASPERPAEAFPMLMVLEGHQYAALICGDLP